MGPRRLLIPLLLLSLAGCSATNISDLIKELAKDPAANCILVSAGPAGAYGSIMTARGTPKASVTMTAGSCIIQGSDTTTVTVPVSNVSVSPAKP